jgi:hypothetical protein
MHGSAWRGDGARLLHAPVDILERERMVNVERDGEGRNPR